MVELIKVGRSFFSLSLLAFAACLSVTAETTRIFNWDVKYSHRFPDCFKKIAITINGDLPGPTITADEGDTIVVNVKNHLVTENVAIHWHGIRQKQTPWADGTAAVTQCPIQPGEEFEYNFEVDRPGTYMYHAHYGLQMGTGLYGMIIVRPRVPDPFHYNFEQHILLTDWYHNSTYEQALGLSSDPYVWVGNPDSILIQGRGRFDCNKLASGNNHCNLENPECAPHTITVEPGQTIRLRIGSLTSLSTLSFEIEDHEMTVVEADGHYVQPVNVNHLYIYSGETYSVIIKTNHIPTRNYWISAKVVDRNSSTPSGSAILNYSPIPRLQPPPTPLPPGPAWDATDDRIAQSKEYKAREGHVMTPPPTSDRLIVLLNTQNRIGGKIRWSVNNVSLNLPHTPYLIAVKEKLPNAYDEQSPPDKYYDAKNVEATTGSGIYRLTYNSVVDVILQNAITPEEGLSETHPWHLHGHDFWVLGYGTGKFDSSKDPATYNLNDPIKKNTVTLHPRGWTALRFRADNPGVWAFHCHVEYHFFLGMAVVFEAGIDQVGQLPDSIKGCGLTKGHKP